MKRTKILYTFIFSIVFLLSVGVVAQPYQSDSLRYNEDILSLHKRISIGASVGKRTEDLSVKMGLQFLTYVNWENFDLGLGINYEDENYFNLMPAYLHFAYAPFNQDNTKMILQSGLAFNIPQSANYDYGKPGIMLGFGIEQPFILFKKLPANFQLIYRYQETSTIREWNANQNNINSSEIKHSMHRLIFVLGINF